MERKGSLSKYQGLVISISKNVCYCVDYTCVIVTKKPFSNNPTNVENYLSLVVFSVWM